MLKLATFSHGFSQKKKVMRIIVTITCPPVTVIFNLNETTFLEHLKI